MNKTVFANFISESYG